MHKCIYVYEHADVYARMSLACPDHLFLCLGRVNKKEKATWPSETMHVQYMYIIYLHVNTKKCAYMHTYCEVLKACSLIAVITSLKRIFEVRVCP